MKHRYLKAYLIIVATVSLLALQQTRIHLLYGFITNALIMQRSYGIKKLTNPFQIAIISQNGCPAVPAAYSCFNKFSTWIYRELYY